MIVYGPGRFYKCTKCGSEMIRFVFDEHGLELGKTMQQIRLRKITLSSSLNEYGNDDHVPKWICKICYNCGIVIL